MGVMKVLLNLCMLICLSDCWKNETRMIVDVIKSYERPTTVMAKVCWNASEKLNLMVHLMKASKPVTVLLISDLKEIKNFDPKDTIIVIDLSCQDSAKFLQQADDDNMCGKPYRWLIISKTTDYENIPTELTNIKVLVDSEVIVADKMANNTFLLNLMYRIDLTSIYRTEEFGIWTIAEGFKLSETIAKTTLAIRRKDLQGKPIAVSYVITDNSTRTKLNQLTDLRVDNLAKVTHHNIIPLFYFMNATNTMIFTDTWGYCMNNSWGGMTGHIVNGEAELSGTVSFMNLERSRIVQYITQPIRIRAKFVFREPALSFQNNLFLLPFRSAVWMCIGGMVALLILIIYINAKWEATKEETIIKDSTILKPNVSDIGIFVISAITQQGSTNELKGSLGRVVTFLMFLIFLFLYTSYSANIVALLQSSSNQIRTLTDLLNSKLELGVEDEKYNRHYFPAATEPVRKAIYENKIAKIGHKPNFMSLEEGVKKLRNKDAPFAYHMNLGVGYKTVEELFLEHEKCGLREIAYYPNSAPWLYSRKDSPYVEIYKIGLARVFEHGIADRVNRIFYVSKPFCNMRGGSFASVNMVDFHPVLLGMLYGISLSLVLLMVEILLHRKQGEGLRNPVL